MDRSVTDQNVAIGRMLRAVRTGLRITLEDFAERIGTSAGTLSRLETGQRNVSTELQERVAEVVAAELRERVPIDAHGGAA